MNSPFIFKGAGKGGKTPTEAPDNLFSNQIARVLDLLSEGEIEGIVGTTEIEKKQSIFYNEVPLVDSEGTSNFNGVIVLGNNGTPEQSAIPGFDNVRSSIAVSQELPYDVYKTASFPNDGSITAAVITLSATNFFQVEDDGDTVGTSVTFVIELSEDSGPFVPAYSGTISGKQTDEYTKDYRIQIQNPVGNTAFRVKRTKPDSDSLKVNDAISFKTLTKVVEHTLSYPNCAVVGHVIDAQQFGNQIPTRQYRVKGIKCRIPHNYDPVTRTYTGAFNGTLTTEKYYTNCGPWVLYEIVTNKRFGLGDFMDPALLDIPTLYQTGKFADELVPDGQGGMEPRWVCNTVISTRGEAFNVLKELVSNFRATLFWMQAKLWTIGDGPKEPVKLVTNANVIGGKFTYSGESDGQRVSVVNVSFNDPSLFYRRSIESVEDPNLIREIGHKTKDFGAFGCSSRSQARRLGRAIIFSQEFESGIVSYKAAWDHTAVYGDGPDGLAPGDLILISDRARGNTRCGGRVTAVDGTIFTASSSAEQTGAGTVYIEHAATGLVESLACTYVNDEITITETPAEDVSINDLFLLIDDGFDAETFVVLKITEEDKGVVGVSAVKWDEDRYNAIYNDIHIDTTDYMTLPNATTCKPVSNLTATEKFIINTDEYQRVIDVNWTLSPDPYLSHTEVAYSFNNDDWIKLPPAGGTIATIRGVKAGTYRIRASAVNRLGVYSLPTAIELVVEVVPSDETLPVGDIVDIELDNGTGAGSTVFSGRDPKIKWNVITPLSKYLDAVGATVAQETKGLFDKGFKACVVTVKKPDDTILRVESIVDTFYTYTWEKNFEDNAGEPIREIKFEVQYQDLFDRLSDPLSAPEVGDAIITVSNPSPELTVPTEQLFSNSIMLNFDDASNDPDFAGYVMWHSAVSGFTPDAGSKIWQGRGNPLLFIEPGTTGYYRYALFDAFGTDSLNVSAEVEYTAPTADANKTAQVFIYQRAASAPTLPSLDTTYTFASGTLTGLDNGWTQSIPSGTDPIWVSLAIAYSTGASDVIEPHEWADAVVMSSSVLNSATLFLFKRTEDTVPPSLPTTASTYTFSTGALTGFDNGWTVGIPDTGGPHRWVTTAAALSAGATDSIPADEWADPVILAQDGIDAVEAELSEPVIYLDAGKDDVVASYASATGQFLVKTTDGVDISTHFTFDTALGGNPNGLTVGYVGNTYTITAGFDDVGEDTATLTIEAIGTGDYAGYILYRALTLHKTYRFVIDFVANANDRNGLTPDAITLVGSPSITRTFTSGNVSVGQEFSFPWSVDPDHKNNYDAIEIGEYYSTSSSTYTWGSNQNEERYHEILFAGLIQRRWNILVDRAANVYYSFRIRPVRYVHKDIDATGKIYGTPVYITAFRPNSVQNHTGSINSVTASVLTAATSNFNADNDANGLTPTSASSVSINGVVHKDSTIALAISFAYTVSTVPTSANNIDGYLVGVYKAISSGYYGYSQANSSDWAWQVLEPHTKNARFVGPADWYYNTVVIPFRRVRTDIDADGIIYGTPVQGSVYNSYNTPVFLGNVNNISATNVALYSSRANNVIDASGIMDDEVDVRQIVDGAINAADWESQGSTILVGPAFGGFHAITTTSVSHVTGARLQVQCLIDYQVSITNPSTGGTVSNTIKLFAYNVGTATYYYQDTWSGDALFTISEEWQGEAKVGGFDFSRHTALFEHIFEELPAGTYKIGFYAGNGCVVTMRPHRYMRGSDLRAAQ